jgi:hypothetical protein
VKTIEPIILPGLDISRVVSSTRPHCLPTDGPIRPHIISDLPEFLAICVRITIEGYAGVLLIQATYVRDMPPAPDCPVNVVHYDDKPRSLQRGLYAAEECHKDILPNELSSYFIGRPRYRKT